MVQRKWSSMHCRETRPWKHFNPPFYHLFCWINIKCYYEILIFAQGWTLFQGMLIEIHRLNVTNSSRKNCVFCTTSNPPQSWLYISGVVIIAAGNTSGTLVAVTEHLHKPSVFSNILAIINCFVLTEFCGKFWSEALHRFPKMAGCFTNARGVFCQTYSVFCLNHFRKLTSNYQR